MRAASGSDAFVAVLYFTAGLKTPWQIEHQQTAYGFTPRRLDEVTADGSMAVEVSFRARDSADAIGEALRYGQVVCGAHAACRLVRLTHKITGPVDLPPIPAGFLHPECEVAI